MKEKKLGISLKYKLLVLLTAVPVASLAIYIMIATRMFESDKLAYVKDSSVAVAKSLAVQFRMEINGFLEKIKPIVESYDDSARQFSSASQDLFNRQERLDALIIMQREQGGGFVQIGEMKKANQFSEKFAASKVQVEQWRNEALEKKLVVTNVPFSDLHLVVATVIGEETDLRQVVVLGLYRATELHNAFVKANIYQHFLIDEGGRVRLGPEGAEIAQEAVQAIKGSNLPEGALDLWGERPQIVSYADAGVAGMKITAIVDRSEALAAVNALLLQSLLFFVALISTTVIVSVIASVRLTSALRDLYEATKLIAKGQFDVRVKRTSNDEVGGLADGFNFMAGEVSRLMVEAGDKARMAGELETVRIVQETLFPVEKMSFGKFQVAGHFEPASECGGDWWNYSQSGDKLFLWIGDATGHGAPAAMVTSAAKAAATIIEDMPYMTPGKALEILNKAIHETSKGRILMTFFIACIDMKTGELTYANASHEPPYLIHTKRPGEKVSKKDLTPLLDSRGPRLGEKRGAMYPEGRCQLAEGDLLLFYTDGIVDLQNAVGKAWGERGFVKSICESAAAGASAEMKLSKLKSNITTYREKSELIDDITLLVCQYGEVA